MLDPKETFSLWKPLRFPSLGLENGMAQKPRVDGAREGAGDRVPFVGA